MAVSVFVRVCLEQLYDWPFNRALLALRREWRRRNPRAVVGAAWLASLLSLALVGDSLPRRTP